MKHNAVRILILQCAVESVVFGRGEFAMRLMVVNVVIMRIAVLNLNQIQERAVFLGSMKRLATKIIQKNFVNLEVDFSEVNGRTAMMMVYVFHTAMVLVPVAVVQNVICNMKLNVVQMVEHGTVQKHVMVFYVVLMPILVRVVGGMEKK